MFKIIAVRFGQVILAIVWLYGLSNLVLLGAAALCDHFKTAPNGVVNIALRQPFSSVTMLALFFFWFLFYWSEKGYKWLAGFIPPNKQRRI